MLRVDGTPNPKSFDALILAWMSCP